MGGQSWTEKVAERIGLTRSSAERYKRDFGLTAGESAGCSEITEGLGLTALAGDVLKDDLTELCTETERSFEYILQCYPGVAPGVLVLVGGSARMFGLAAALSGHLGIEVVPLAGLDTPAVRLIVEGLGDSERIEVQAQACALSFQGNIDA